MDTRTGVIREAGTFHETPLHAPTLHAPPRIADTLPPYEAALFSRKLTPATVETYSKAVRSFAAFLGADATIADVTFDSIGRYQVARRARAAATISKSLNAIRSYCRWCIRVRLRLDDPTLEIEWPKRVDPLPRALSTDELRRLDRALESALPLLNVKKRRVRSRDRLSIMLMLYSGLRLSETVALDWRDLDLAARTMTVREGKGRQFRVLPLHDRLLALLDQTPQAARIGAVLQLRNGNRINKKTLNQLFFRWLREDYDLVISAHMLRHTFAVSLLRNGADLRSIQVLLGHRSLATTERYLALDMHDKQRAIERLPARW